MSLLQRYKSMFKSLQSPCTLPLLCNFAAYTRTVFHLFLAHIKHVPELILHCFIENKALFFCLVFYKFLANIFNLKLEKLFTFVLWICIFFFKKKEKHEMFLIIDGCDNSLIHCSVLSALWWYDILPVQTDQQAHVQPVTNFRYKYCKILKLSHHRRQFKKNSPI